MNQSRLKHLLTLLIICIAQVSFAQTTTNVKPFTKVIISPNIQVTFIEGNEESVTIENCTVSKDSLHIEVNDNTLRIYLEGQKDFPKNETTNDDGYKHKEPVYKGTIVTATVTYKTFNNLSVRGEETQLCKSTLQGKQFKVKIYGESKVVFDEVNLDRLEATMYGESTFEIKAGTIKDQRYIAYGENDINVFAISNKTTKITAYGESNFKINASDAIKMTAYGDAKLEFKGSAQINKGLTIGDVQITKVD